MPQKPVSDEVLILTLAAKEEHKSTIDTARALGVDTKTVVRRLKQAAMRGLDDRAPNAPPGYYIQKLTEQYSGGELIGQSIKYSTEHGGAFKLPPGHRLKGVSALVDADGNKMLEWLKTTEGSLSTETIIETVKEALEGFDLAAQRQEAPEVTDEDLLTLYPLADLHLGLYAWADEAEIDWDLRIAVDKYRATMERLMQASPASSMAIILGGGDLLHADNYENRTTKSGNVLDVDNRYPKVLYEACQLIVFQTELALARHSAVEVRLLPGNHDLQSAIAITYFLKAYYRDEPRVAIDDSPSLFWWREHGETLLGATHGHEAKIADMPLLMASRVPEMWGRTKYRYAHGFHIHHKTRSIFEAGGVIAETHQSPVAQDAYHWGKGYLSGRSMQTITYSAQWGEFSRNRIVVR